MYISGLLFNTQALQYCEHFLNKHVMTLHFFSGLIGQTSWIALHKISFYPMLLIHQIIDCFRMTKAMSHCCSGFLN